MDGINDGDELALGIDPLKADSDEDGIIDGNEDSDSDGLNDADEL